MDTAQIADPLSGDKLYQQRARAALPLLVRLAHAGSKITYSELADALGMSNARTLNYPLGSIGQALLDLGEHWGEKIPMIQCLVLNKQTGLPGEGIGWFIENREEFASMSRGAQRKRVESVLADVFTYTRWDDVLDALGLEPDRSDFSSQLESASQFRGSGESEAHKALKRHVALTPRIVGLPQSAAQGEEEYALPSGDSLDVYFRHNGIRTAVEVKSRISDQSDISRGLFQCIKYSAVLEAVIAAENSSDSFDAVLVLESQFPDDLDLQKLRRILGVRVVDNVSVSTSWSLHSDKKNARPSHKSQAHPLSLPDNQFGS